MKTIHPTTPFLAFCCLLALACAAVAQGGQQSNEIASSSGIFAKIRVIWDETNRSGLPAIDVSVRNTNAGDFFGGPPLESALDFAKQLGSDKLLFFRATNLFCGPIELRNARDQKLPFLKPEVNLLQAYPATFSLSYAKNHNPRPRMTYPESLIASPASLVRFQLGDYFTIREPGEYKLTVWPKIYKRASADEDLCSRLDLPPISVTFKWRVETE